MSATAFFCVLTCASQARWDALEQVLHRLRLVRETEARRARVFAAAVEEL